MQDDDDSDIELETGKALSLFELAKTNPDELLNQRRKEDFRLDKLGIILDKKYCLEDQHMNAASAILREQFPDVGGLFNVQWVVQGGFQHAKEETWIQFINIKNIHWIMASKGFDGNQEGVIEVFDSQTSQSVCKKYPDVLITALGQLENSTEPKFKFVPCQDQGDGSSCGVFAIAFATALVFKKHLGKCRFEKDKMRSHLRDCILSGELSPFPEIQMEPVEMVPSTNIKEGRRTLSGTVEAVTTALPTAPGNFQF